MKKLIIALVFSSIYFNSSALDREFNIQIQVKGIKNEDGILASNYGEKKFIADTLHFDGNGIAKIKGTKSFEDGIYLVAFPSLDLRSFEFVIRETAFQLSTDTTNLLMNMKVKGSLENQVMYEDLKRTVEIGRRMDSLNKITAQEGVADDLKNQVKDEITNLNKTYIDNRIASIEKNPTALYNKVIGTLRDVPMQPDSTGKVNYNYYIQHYWDNVDFSDVALMKSPVLLPRVFKFLDEIYQQPDSINHAIDIILDKSAVNEESFKILSSEIINKYAKSNIMGQEAIYVHLLDKYYLAGKTPWVDEETLGKMRERADAMRPTLIGKIAPNIIVYGMNNLPLNFYQAIDTNNYTILVFWNSECSHCKKEIPELLQIWQDSLHYQYKVGVFAVSTEVEQEHVLKFIEENKMDGQFINAYDPTGRSNFRNLYDINSTPVVILLDKNKKIIAKKVGVNDIPYVISTYEEFLKEKATSDKTSSE